MEDNNNNNIKEEVSKKTVEGFEIVSEKATELDKKQFFKMLAKAEEGLDLTIDRVGSFFYSKYDKNKIGCFVDYTFTEDSKKYEIGIYYNLAKPTIVDYDKEGNPIYKVRLTENMNIFKILAVAVDLSEAEEIKVTEEFIKNTLTGITFKAEVGSSYNGGFLIEPVELLETTEGIVDPTK